MEVVDIIFGLVENCPGWFWYVLLLGPVLAMLVFHLTMGARRGGLWERAAMVLGYVHQDEDSSLSNTFKMLDSFSDVDGFETRSLDVLRNEAGGVQTWLLDHASGKPRKLRTACVMRSGELQVPHFRLLQTGGRLRPRGGRVSFQDDPDFSGTFVLTADDTEAIRDLFDPALRQYFQEMARRCREIERANTDWFSGLMLRLSNAIGHLEIEAAGDTLGVHLGRIINPQGASELLAVTGETLQRLQRGKK